MVQRYLKVSKSCSVPTSPRAYIFMDSNQRLQNMPRIQGNFQTCQTCQENCQICQATNMVELIRHLRTWIRALHIVYNWNRSINRKVTLQLHQILRLPRKVWLIDPRRSETVLNMIRDQTRHLQPLTFSTSGSWNWDFFRYSSFLLLFLSVALFFLIRLDFSKSSWLGSLPTQLPFDHWLHGLQLLSKFVSSH